MAYSALYRKFRPERFGQIIGQPHITSILLNQIRSGRVAHAYLFSGSRGTGKTSTARILAKAINCLDPQDGEPCGRCAACLSKESVDIIEMDAASNSRVEEMRALIERAEFAPLELKTKVYIIDEAHMLTKNASNALLKTLEEPPAHVVFILATTEPQMLPATIVSRCQRFEFHRLRVADMVESLKTSLSAIGAHIDDGGLIAIARAAEGGMRDCLSIADQCLSFCGGAVSENDVMNVLGSVNFGFLSRLADAVIDSDEGEVMRLVAQVVSSGRDLGVFAQDAAAHFRALLLTKICGNCRDLLDCTEEMMADYSAQAQRIPKERAERAVEELVRLQLDLKLVSTPRTLVESTLLRICHPEGAGSLAELSDRINVLEHDMSAVAEKAVKAAREQAASMPARRADENGGIASDGVDGAGEEAVVEIPESTPDADELFEKLLAAVELMDPALPTMLKFSSGHWLEDKVLHITFAKDSSFQCRYVQEPLSKETIKNAARESIAPYTAVTEVVAGAVRKKRVTELLGVPIRDK
ncbi:MAG: DNA polymerase III subunit gamma/tau [Clostridia bacterium]|nr:DNA polymerase III subunit gamma/tau [Clostridia bacterium]